MKLSYKSNNNKKAFTLIELLIVIAIIGILFIVLVSKVDFATDKAKATGVQTDFRSFQLALDQVAKENTGFNIFGWDTGDDNGDRIRNSYDRGDTNKNGEEDPGETFIGRKTYGEDWTSIYTMLNPKEGMENDISAFVALEQAINANLDPKLHITITPDVDGGALTGNATITMANQARDPWKNEYHGVFITNAESDSGADRGAIIIYSDGANGVWGSAHNITNGVVEISVPNNNVAGQDDYAIVSCYTYINGYGEVKNLTTGFSTNQGFLNGASGSDVSIGGNNNEPSNPELPEEPSDTNIIYEMTTGDIVVEVVEPLVFRSLADVSKFKEFRVNDVVVDPVYYTVTSGSTVVTLSANYVQRLENGIYSVEIVSSDGKAECTMDINVPKTEVAGLYDTNNNVLLSWSELVAAGFVPDIDHATEYGDWMRKNSGQLAYILEANGWIDDEVKLVLDDSVERIGCFALYGAKVVSLTIGKNVSEIYTPINWLSSLREIIVVDDNPYMYSVDNTVISKDGKTVILGCGTSVIPYGVVTIGPEAFMHSGITSIVLPDTVTLISVDAFSYTKLQSVVLSANLQTIEAWAFASTDLVSITIPSRVTNIESHAFVNCYDLQEVVNLSTLNIVKGTDTHGHVAYYAATVR